MEALKGYNLIEDGPMSNRDQAMLYYDVLSRGEMGATFFCHISDYYGQYCTRDKVTFLRQFAKYWNNENCYMPLNLFTGNWENRWKTKLKQYKWGFHREQKDVTYINGILLDFDIMKGELAKANYTIEEGNKYIEEVISTIDMLVKEGKMARPTLVTKSGRGLQMILLYKEPISIEDEASVFKHRRLYSKITSFLQEQFDKEYIEVDRCVKDYSRICRLPGTKHTKNGVYAELREYNPSCYYEVGELCDLLCVDLTPEEKKKPGRKPGLVVVSEKKEKKERREFYALPKNVIPYIGIVKLKNVKSMIKLIEKLAFKRGMVDGQGRELMVFWYYNFCRQTTTASGAGTMAWQFNKFYFKEPLEYKEFEAVIDGVNAHKGDESYPDGYYVCCRDTLVEELNMTPEEIEYTGIFKRREAKESASINKASKEEWKAAIKEMVESGVPESKIVREYVAITGKSRQTIYNWISEQKKLSNFGSNQKEEVNREDTKGTAIVPKKEAKVVSINGYTDKEERKEMLMLGRLMVFEKKVRYYDDGTFVVLSYFTLFYDKTGNLIDKKDNLEIIKEFDEMRESG